MDHLELQDAQQEYVAQGCLTWSKHKSSFVEGIYPTHAAAVNGPYLKDHRRRKYVDLIAGLGSISIGYAEAVINEAVKKAVNKWGSSASLPTALEVEAAEMLLSECLTTYDQVKFLKTGSEACLASIRIARMATQRDWIYSYGYHGWNDQFLKPPAKGALKELKTMHFESIKDIMASRAHVAAIIVEPVMLEYSDNQIKLLRELKQHANDMGTILIFDEIITGFRVPKFTLSKIIEPDLVILGKGMANGWPLSAVVGKRHLMNQRYFVSSTYAGEVTSLAAHKAVIKYFKDHPFDYLWDGANELQKQINDMIEPIGAFLEGYGTRGRLIGPKHEIFMQELCKNKLLIGKSWFLNYSHMEIQKVILSAFADACYSVQKGATLEGLAPIEPFKRF